MDARKSAIFAFQFVKPVLKTINQMTQYTVLEIQFWPVKCMTVQHAESFSISIPISIPSHQWLQWLD